MRTLLRGVRTSRELWPLGTLLLLASLLPPLAGVAMPLVERQVIDGVLLAHRLPQLPPLLALYAGLWLLSLAALLCVSALRAYLDERVTLGLRQKLYAHRQALSLAFAEKEHSARTMALFANDIPSMASLYSTLLVGLTGSITTVVLGAAAMLRLNVPLAIVAGVLPPLVAALAWSITRPLRPAARRAQEKAAELTERFQEMLAGLREIAAFGQEQRQSQRFGATLRELLRLRMRVTLMDTALQSGQLVLSLVITLVVFGYGGWLVVEGRTTLGTVVAMQALFGLVFQPASQLAGLVSATQKALGAADRVYAALDTAPPVREADGARTPAQIVGEITLEDVSFAYAPGKDVLRHISLRLHPGELVALVGPSGAGKSTLASLLPRFRDPTTGSVLLDGVDLRALTIASVRGAMAEVFQDTFLFAGTIRENLILGCESADDAAILEAARAAYAWEFIERLPNGLDTPVGERGTQLSEGQKQRLAIARALLRDPRILILDEPTSALDARSEYLLHTALRQLAQNRTTLVIAHRLATVRQADRILVLDGGQIVAQGTHAELLARSGLYRELYALQFGTPLERELDGELLEATPAGITPARSLPAVARAGRSRAHPGHEAKGRGK